MIEYIKSLIEEYKNMEYGEKMYCNMLMILIIIPIIVFILLILKYGVR